MHASWQEWVAGGVTVTVLVLAKWRDHRRRPYNLQERNERMRELGIGVGKSDDTGTGDAK